METSHYYQAVNPELWSGRADSLKNERFFQVVQCLDLRHKKLPTTTEPSSAFIGFCSDTGVKRNLGRPGAAEGPDALRQALARLAIPHAQTQQYFDLGNIYCDDDDLENAQRHLAKLVRMCIEKDVRPILFGGGHEIAWGHFQGLHQALPNQKIGIINFDAHFDLRKPTAKNLGTSGTPFYQIAQLAKENFHYFCLGIQTAANTDSLFQTAQTLNVTYLTAEALLQQSRQDTQTMLDTFIHSVDGIYLTICLDVFSQSVAPGVSAPQALGLYPQTVLPLLRHIMASKKVVSLDIAELAPPLDINQMTTNLAAQIVAGIY